jgi:hypothetical protein
MGVIMKIIFCKKKSIILTFFNTYGLSLLVMILLVMKNYSSFMLIFNFSQLVESPQQYAGYSTSILLNPCNQI